MRYLIVFFIAIFFSCKNKNSNKVTSQTSTSIGVTIDIDTVKKFKESTLNTQDTLFYKSLKALCDNKELPLYCSFQDGLNVSFLFEDDPNKIVIKHNESIFTYGLPFFEGLDYSPYVLDNNKEKILIVELVFEYGKKYVVFRIRDKKINFIKDFYLADLVDNEGEFVNHTFSIIQSKKEFVLQIGVEPFVHKEKL